MANSVLQSIFITLCIISISCKSKPTVIVEDTPKPGSDQQMATPSAPLDLHEIKVVDIQHTLKYTYIFAKEGNKSSCIAIPLTKEIKKGNTYYFRGGILMANPEILQFKEKFEVVTIAPGLNENPLGEGSIGSSSEPSITSASGGTKIKEVKIVTVAGVLKLADLYKKPELYDGKTIKVQGQCVKVNRMIMNKNWLHIQDNTTNKQGQKFDLTITTLDEVQLGDIVIFEGKIAINKDFGAGYTYDVILEEAKLIK